MPYLHAERSSGSFAQAPRALGGFFGDTLSARQSWLKATRLIGIGLRAIANHRVVKAMQLSFQWRESSKSTKSDLLVLKMGSKPTDTKQFLHFLFPLHPKHPKCRHCELYLALASVVHVDIMERARECGFATWVIVD